MKIKNIINDKLINLLYIGFTIAIVLLQIQIFELKTITDFNNKYRTSQHVCNKKGDENKSQLTEVKSKAKSNIVIVNKLSLFKSNKDKNEKDFNNWIRLMDELLPIRPKCIDQCIWNESIPFCTKVNKIRCNNNLPKVSINFIRLLMYNWINSESSFNSKAISKSGDYGLLQINFNIWHKHFKLKSPRILLNPKTNIDYAIQIFIKYLKISHGYITNALEMYNNGFESDPNNTYAYNIMHKTIVTRNKLKKR